MPFNLQLSMKRGAQSMNDVASSISAISSEDISQRGYASFEDCLPVGRVVGPSFGAVDLPVIQIFPNDREAFTQEVRVWSHTSGKLQWLGGLHYRDADRALVGSYMPWIGDPAADPLAGARWLDQDSAVSVEEKAVFGELYFNFTERLLLTAGGRFFDYRQTTTGESSGRLARNMGTHEMNILKGFLCTVMAVTAIGLSACSKRHSWAPDGIDNAATVAGGPVDLFPGSWPRDELQAYLELTAGGSPDLKNRTGLKTSGKHGVVSATSVPMAVHAGVKALQQGGSAMDAVLTTALTQIALTAGGPMSYAGTGGLTYFEAETGEVHFLDFTWAVPMEEKDPLSVPPYGTPSGRGVLVSGFMAGVEAAHKRFGKLAFGEIFEPAIYFAEEGFELSAEFADRLQRRGYVLTRRPEGRAIFQNANGELLKAGETLRQPQVAQFLRKVAKQGSRYMHQGAWAEEFVKAVREEGGKVTLEDLKQYAPAWQSFNTSFAFREFEVYANDLWKERFKLLELADLRTRGHYQNSAEALYWVVKIYRVSQVLGALSAQEVIKVFPKLDLSGAHRYSYATLAQIWESMHRPGWKTLETLAEKKQADRLALKAESITNLTKDFRRRDPKSPPDTDGEPGHTAGVIAIDSEGNMATLTHTVNSAVWGELGIFIEGVSITDPASWQQERFAAMGAGSRPTRRVGEVPTGPMLPLALKAGVPYLGCGLVGVSGRLNLYQIFVDSLEYGMKGDRIVQTPKFHDEWNPLLPVREPIGEAGDFSRELLLQVKAMGLNVEAVADRSKAAHGGGVACGIVSPATGSRSGFVFSNTGHVNASAIEHDLVEAY